MLKFIILLLAMISVAPQVSADVSFGAGVNVQAEADNAALARDNAMKQAHREAFLKVASRLTTQSNVEELNKLTDDQLLHFIREVSVVAEKSGRKTYMADLNVEINGELLKQYMEENNMLEAVSTPTDVLIIPVYGDTEFNDRVLWEDGNIWRSAWLDKGLIKSGSLTLKVIEDNEPNRQLLTVDNAVNMQKNTYESLINLHKIRNIFVVNAVRAGRNNMVVIIRSFPNISEKRFVVNDDNGQTLEKAISETVGYISNAMQNRTVVSGNQKGNLTALFYYDNLQQWLDTKKRLQEITQVKNVELEAMGGGQIRLSLDYIGSDENLLTALEQADMSLQSYNGVYILK